MLCANCAWNLDEDEQERGTYERLPPPATQRVSSQAGYRLQMPNGKIGRADRPGKGDADKNSSWSTGKNDDGNKASSWRPSKNLPTELEAIGTDLTNVAAQVIPGCLARS